MKKLVLIDGKSVYYRGYYAMGHLSRRDGRPTGGVYGFAVISLELVKRLQPDKVVVAWDSPTSTAQRRELYPEYKAGRHRPPEDFYAQIPDLKKLVGALEWTLVELDGYEADDIIGTLGQQAERAGWQTVIISSDLDMLQVVDQNVKMYRLLKGFSDLEEMDVPAVETKYGIRKEQFLDLKALKGDASDNIPGVPGIGEKGAVKLLNIYDTLDGIYTHLSDITGATGRKLAAGKDLAYLSRRLATIMTDAPVQLEDLADFQWRPERVVEAFRELEFNSLIRKFEKELHKSGADIGQNNAKSSDLANKTQSKSSSANKDNESTAASDGEHHDAHASAQEINPSKYHNANVSTEATDPEQIYNKKDENPDLKTVSNESTKIHLTPENSMDAKKSNENPPTNETIPKDLILAWDIKTLMHNDPAVAEAVLSGSKFWDLGQGSFLLYGRTVDGATDDAQAQVTDIRDVSAAEKADKVGDASTAEQAGSAEISTKAKNMTKIPTPTPAQVGEYHRQKSAFRNLPKLQAILENYDLPLIPVLYKMEKCGIKVNLEYFKQLADEFTKEVAEREAEIIKLAGTSFNVNSPVQLSDILFNKLALPTAGIKKTTRGYSTGAKELEKLKTLHPIVPKILEYREAAKLLSTYILPVPKLADANSRIHTTYTQNVTATGRLSSLNPNLQNIPVRTEEGRRIRQGYVAGEGRKFVSADYSQFELRLAAALAGDQALIDDFNSGLDIHTKTAADVFKVKMEEVSPTQRRAAKVINFGVLYGMSAKGLADATGMTVAAAKNFIDEYFTVRSPIREYLDGVLKQARTVGYVETLYGRRRAVPEVRATNFIVRAAAERAAANMPIQGTEADLMKRAMIRVDAALPEGADLVLQVHDSIMVECDGAQTGKISEILCECMEEVAPELPVRLKVDVKVSDYWV